MREAKVILERTGERNWRPEHHRLHGVLLAALGADEAQVVVSHQHRKGAEIGFASETR